MKNDHIVQGPSLEQLRRKYGVSGPTLTHKGRTPEPPTREELIARIERLENALKQIMRGTSTMGPANIARLALNPNQG